MSVEVARLEDVRNLKAPAVFLAAVRMASSNWTVGKLTFVLPDGATVPLKGKEPGPDARLIIHDFRGLRRALMAGDIGFAEGYIAGEWDTPDLAALLEVLCRNFDHINELGRGNIFITFANACMHALNSNSRRGSRRNIYAHYDLGNAFYSRWLDETMTYSSARYEHPGQSLSDAQTHKYASLARAMHLSEGHSVLEIGCGWGGFAEYAAKEVGARVTGITISKAQYEFARQRLFEQGLADKADIRLVDYRDVQGRFDRIASIEMFEAVGEKYWPTYFGKVHSLLEDDGVAGLQIITIRDQDFADYRRRPDFIQKYIFPGGMLPSETRLREEIARAGLSQQSANHFGLDYAETLAEWARRFEASWNEIQPLGFDEKFRRLWRFYLAYCEAGFRGGRSDVVQVALTRA
jgi:cyclopropane-fatty-acyl-phospholipid synthase